MASFLKHYFLSNSLKPPVLKKLASVKNSKGQDKVSECDGLIEHSGTKLQSSIASDFAFQKARFEKYIISVRFRKLMGKNG